MASPDTPAFIASAPTLPSDQDLDALENEIQRVAEERGLSPRTTDRYEAWIFGFISWCIRTPPHQVEQRRIDEFRAAIEAHANSDQQDAYEAMDALAFLYGAIEDVDEILPSSIEHPNDDGTRPDSESSESQPPTTLNVGWQE